MMIMMMMIYFTPSVSESLSPRSEDLVVHNFMVIFFCEKKFVSNTIYRTSEVNEPSRFQAKSTIDTRMFQIKVLIICTTSVAKCL